MKTPLSRLLGIAVLASVLMVAAACTAPSSPSAPPEVSLELERRVDQLEGWTRELKTRNDRLEELLASQKEEQRRLQSAIGTLRSELQQEIDRRLAAEKREAVIKERFLSARLEAIELQTKLYELQMEDSASSTPASGR